jgi:hypothetical protein
MCLRLALAIVVTWTSGCATCRPRPTVILEPDPTAAQAIQGAVPTSMEIVKMRLDEVIDGAAIGVKCDLE